MYDGREEEERRYNGPHSLWVIYDHPHDVPDFFVARRWEVGARQDLTATGDTILSDDLELIRRMLAAHGMSCIREGDRNPVIIEVWG